MGRLRVLIVDDAVVFRRLLADELAKDPALEVVGTAANGRIALNKLPQVNPDVVILDVEMPEMDGLTALAELRKSYRRLPVIMFSSLTERGAAATLDALALGATDYFTKPVSAGGVDTSLEVIRQQLIPKIKAVCSKISPVQAHGTYGTHGTHGSPTSHVAPKSHASPSSPTSHVSHKSHAPAQVIAIGASTGGPNALLELFSLLPAHFPVPILIVQHMPPMFTRLLAERLTAQSSFRVQEGSSGTILLPGQAWIAPGDFHMMVVRDAAHTRLLLHQDMPENSCRPAVDVLLRSLAKVYGPNSLTIILTGMGHDGVHGCEAVREAGGQILVQDEESSVVWGMPGNVARAVLADKVLPLALLADEIKRRVLPGQAQDDGVADMTDRDFDFVRKLLKDRCGILLEAGKQYLVETRLGPLVHQLNLHSLSDLISQVRDQANNGLLTQIVEAMVTTETSFFRDHIPWETLRKSVLPDLLKRRAQERKLNIWCAACSTGQEPYSIAILIRESFPLLLGWDLNILGTDLSRDVLERAQLGRYNQIEANRGMPAVLLVKYFEQHGTSWQLKNDIRSMVKLQELNLARPWPYLPQMDLIILRNVMIYFDMETKKSLLSRVARLLKPDGYLLLGGAETTINLVDSFRRIEDLKSGFYQLLD